MFKSSKTPSEPEAPVQSQSPVPAASPNNTAAITPVKPASGPSIPPSIISSELTLTGDLSSTGEIQIDGQVDGDITSRALTIGEKGTVTGSVSAETVRVCGTLTGQIKAKNVTLTKTAKLHGDILHESLSIEAGALIDGNVRRTEAATSSNSKISVLKPQA